MEELLKDILAELKKINEYIDIQKATTLIKINDNSASKKGNATYQEVLKAYRQYLKEE